MQELNYSSLSDKNKEQDVLALLMTDVECRALLFSKLNVVDFYNTEHKKIYSQLREDFYEYGDVDITKIKGFSRFLQITHVSFLITTEKTWKELKELTKKRELLELSFTLQESLKEDKADDLLEVVVNSSVAIKQDNIAELQSPEVEDVFNDVKKRWELIKGKEIIGEPINCFLDKVIYGYQEGHYWVIGAYTSYGKTTFACWLAGKTSKETTAVFFSTEMTQQQTLEKILVQHIKKPINIIRNDNEDKYTYKIDEIIEKNIIIYDNIFTVEAMRLELIALKWKVEGPVVVFVDFIQNVIGEGGTQYERLSNVTLQLQRLAMDFRITVIALSQISNEGVKRNSEVMPFKGSGDIASSADLALQIMRNKMMEEDEGFDLVDFEIVCKKNRHGQRIGSTMLLDRTTGILFKSDERTRPERADEEEK